MEDALQNINEKLDQILHILKKGKDQEDPLEGYISEQEAKELLNRGTTWFWELRRKGFPFKKLGGQVYYQKSAIIRVLKDPLPQ